MRRFGVNIIDYIYEQPALFQEALQQRQTICRPFVTPYQKTRPDRIYLVASGTSKNAALSAVPFMETILGISVDVVESSRSCEFRGKSPFVIFISQGGNSTNTIAAIQRASSYHTLTMTGNPKGEIGKVSSTCLFIPCGEENVGPKTKGYTLTVLTLYLMALEGALAVGSITPNAYQSYIDVLVSTGKHLRENIDTAYAWVMETNRKRFRELGVTYVVGKGQATAVACESALKIMETLLVPAFGFEFEEFLHGPVCSLSKNVGGIYLMPCSANKDYSRMQTIAHFHRETSPSVFIVGADASDERDIALKTSGCEYTVPFEEVIPIQIVSAKIPAESGIDGVGSKRFKHIDELVFTKFKQ